MRVCDDSNKIQFGFRCIHLAQPPLDQGDIHHIEKIISIYVNDDSDGMETVTSNDSTEVKVYTLEDDVQPTNEPKTNQTASIWREAPGNLHSKLKRVNMSKNRK